MLLHIYTHVNVYNLIYVSPYINSSSYRNALNFDDIAGGVNKRRVIHKTVFNELIRLIDPQVKPFEPVRGKSNVIMFVGLQGSGKTTTCTKVRALLVRMVITPTSF